MGKAVPKGRDPARPEKTKRYRRRRMAKMRAPTGSGHRPLEVQPAEMAPANGRSTPPWPTLLCLPDRRTPPRKGFTLPCPLSLPWGLGVKPMVNGGGHKGCPLLCEPVRVPLAHLLPMRPSYTALVCPSQGRSHCSEYSFGQNYETYFVFFLKITKYIS